MLVLSFATDLHPRLSERLCAFSHPPEPKVSESLRSMDSRSRTRRILGFFHLCEPWIPHFVGYPPHILQALKLVLAPYVRDESCSLACGVSFFVGVSFVIRQRSFRSAFTTQSVRGCRLEKPATVYCRLYSLSISGSFEVSLEACAVDGHGSQVFPCPVSKGDGFVGNPLEFVFGRRSIGSGTRLWTLDCSYPTKSGTLIGAEKRPGGGVWRIRKNFCSILGLCMRRP